MRLELQQLSARHFTAPPAARAALRGINLAVRNGEQLAIIGPSGAGKTTLLHTLACALRPSAGALLVAKRDPWALSRADLQDLRATLFLAPQVPPLPPRQRVVTAVLAGLLPQLSLAQSLRSLFYPAHIARVDAALQRVDLSDKLFARVDRLSGGERQRVGLARLLVSQATLLLVDEPLSALDPTRAQQVITTLTNAATERAATLVVSLHHVEMALRHFPRIVGLRDGELAFDLPAAQVTPALLAELYAQHPHELTGPAMPDALPELTTPMAAPVVMHCR